LLLDFVLAGVFAVVEFAFDVEALAFGKDLGHDFGSLPPGREVVPGGMNFFLAIGSFSGFMGGHGDVGNFLAFGDFFDFDFLSQEADQLYTVVNT